MKEFTWTLKDGRKAKLVATYSATVAKETIDLDGDKFEIDKNIIKEEGEIIAYVEGVEVDHCYRADKSSWELIYSSSTGCKWISGLEKIGFNEETAKKVEEFLKSVREEGSDKEAVKDRNAEEAKKIEEDIDFWSKAVARGEAQTKMMTTAERDAWEKEFNEIYNEGGEGFVPHYISVEELTDIKNRLKELKSKLEHLRIG